MGTAGKRMGAAGAGKRNAATGIYLIAYAMRAVHVRAYMRAYA